MVAPSSRASATISASEAAGESLACASVMTRLSGKIVQPHGCHCRRETCTPSYPPSSLSSPALYQARGSFMKRSAPIHTRRVPEPSLASDSGQCRCERLPGSYLQLHGSTSARRVRSGELSLRAARDGRLFPTAHELRQGCRRMSRSCRGYRGCSRIGGGALLKSGTPCTAA